MSTILVLADARARGITLPEDDDVAQDILDEVEGWLAGIIGPLTGSRTETFYVGVGETQGRLALRRPTDAVSLTDGGVAVTADHIRLIHDGSVIVRTYSAASRWWTGPYVAATYAPNDDTRVRSVLYDCVALAAQPTGPYQSEQIGSYSYNRGAGISRVLASKAALASSLLPKRAPLTLMPVSRRVSVGDPVINRPEYPL
jgi:hypothetical protein